MVLVLLLLLFGCTEQKLNINSILKEKHEIVLAKRYMFGLSNVQVYETDAKITYYTNRKEETDSTPNITASGRFVYEGSCAVSPDLKTKYCLKFGDLVYIEKLDQFFVIEDITNQRLEKVVDIFSYQRVNKTYKSKAYFISFRN
ncbi:MAG: hypothetical protein QXD95_09145 [Nitrososphaeria archaeon]